jgi:hypothetical protein
MGTLKIGGSVRYGDLQSPVKAARVRIYDADTGGDGDDLIFDEVTDASGRFSGSSSNWEDQNVKRISTPLGHFDLKLPDALLLRAQIDVDGQTHQCAYVHLGDGQSAPIVLPWGKPTIKKEQRHLVQIITLSAASNDKMLYDVIEFGARAVIAGLGAPHYQGYTLLERGNATLEGLTEALGRVASQAETRAIDLIFCTHGSTEKVTFHPDVRTSIEDVSASLLGLSAGQRKKFRSVFSTACFGGTHLDAWLDAGFKVASGSVGIYADSALSTPAFLASWSAGLSFGQGIQAANASDIGDFQDQLARGWFKSNGSASSAARVNSTRETRGDTGITINSQP